MTNPPSELFKQVCGIVQAHDEASLDKQRIEALPDIVAALEAILENCYLSFNEENERARQNGAKININDFRANARTALKKGGF